MKNEHNEHLKRAVDAVRLWIAVYRGRVVVAASVPAVKLPAIDRRAELEKIIWQALAQIVEYSKSEEAAKNAKERAQVLELLNHAVKAELAVLHEQDAFYVEEVVNELQTNMDRIDRLLKALDEERKKRGMER